MHSACLEGAQKRTAWGGCFLAATTLELRDVIVAVLRMMRRLVSLLDIGLFCRQPRNRIPQPLLGARGGHSGLLRFVS